MGSIHLKKISLLFLLFSAAIFSSSFAGRPSKFKSVGNPESKEVATIHEEFEEWEHLGHDEVSDIHERLVELNGKDYGRNNPSPVLLKPPPKHVPHPPN